MCRANLKVITLNDYCFGDVDDEVKPFKQKILILFYSFNSCMRLHLLLNTFFFLLVLQPRSRGGRSREGRSSGNA